MKGHYIVKINSRCNANCCFCADSREIRSNEDFEHDKLIKDLEKNRKKFDSLIISGGEPTIYKKLFEYIKYAKHRCKYKHITLTTNGFMLAYSNFTDKLIECGVDSFIISFATSDERMYDATYKVKGAFKYVDKAISNIKKRKKGIRINSVVHKLNYKNIVNTVVYLINKNVDYIQLSFMNPVGSSMVNGKSAIAITFGDIMPFIKKSFEVANGLKFKNLFIENIPLCMAIEYKNYLSDLKKPLENKKYYNNCKSKPKKCQKCEYYDVCDGVWEKYLKQFGDEELEPIKKVVMTNGI
jgi:MoaA/NifB/PqqE/SkfB family radical SAM enzyme